MHKTTQLGYIWDLQPPGCPCNEIPEHHLYSFCNQYIGAFVAGVPIALMALVDCMNFMWSVLQGLLDST